MSKNKMRCWFRIRKGWSKRNFALVSVILLSLQSVGSAQTWWNGSYTYRKQIAVTAGATTIPTAYSVSVTTDHATAVIAGKSQADGDDIRIVYWNDSTNTELDRILDQASSWNGASTKFWFKTQASISASGSDANYYMYYGYGSAASPPANGMNVYLFHDDFPGSSIDGAKWTTITGTPAVAGGVATLTAGGSMTSVLGSAFTYDTRWEANIELGGDGSEPYYEFWIATNNASGGGYTDDFIWMWTDQSAFYAENSVNGWNNGNRTSFSATTPTSYHTYAFERLGTTSVKFYQDITLKATHSTGSNIPTSNLRAMINNDDFATHSILVDWVRVRKYVANEPSASLGAEENGSLPIQLSSFATLVLAGSQHVVLQWTTLSETNNYGFEVQRRGGSTSVFTTLPHSFVPGHGTTNEPRHYSSIDSTVTSGVWYYRLKQLDLDGTQHYTEPVQVEVTTDVAERLTPAEVTLLQNYPNPFNPSTVIGFNLPNAGRVSLVIYDLLGREVETLIRGEFPAGYHSPAWTPKNLAAGVYVCCLRAQGVVIVRKLILLR